MLVTHVTFNKIEAIKEVRSQTGCDLHTAKQLVEKLLETGEFVNLTVEQTCDFGICHENRPMSISALYRWDRGLTLKDPI